MQARLLAGIAVAAALVAAARASAQLERASLRMGPSGDVGKARATPKDTDAEARAKARAKTLKRRRKQAEQVQKMARSIAMHTVVQAVTSDRFGPLKPNRIDT